MFVHKYIEFVENDVREYRAYDASLGDTRLRDCDGFILTVSFDVAGFNKFSVKVDKFGIFDAFR